MAAGGGDCEGAVGGEGFNQVSNVTLDQSRASLLDELIDDQNLKLDDADEQNWLTTSMCKPIGGFGHEDTKCIEDWIQTSRLDFLLESTFSILRCTRDSIPRHANVSQVSKKSLLDKLNRIARGLSLIHI